MDARCVNIETLCKTASAYPLGIIYATAQSRPPAADSAYREAFAARAPRRKRSWIELAPPPPGATLQDLWQLNRAQIHTAIAKRIGGRLGGHFAGAATVDLGCDLNGQARPHLFVATTRYRGPYRFDDRIDVAAMPCTPEVAEYFAHAVPAEVACWAFDRWAQHATYRVVLNKFGGEDRLERFGVARPIR